MDIQDTHPLRSLVKIKDILSVFGICFPEEKKKILSLVYGAL